MDKQTKIAAIIGAFATLILVYFAWKQTSGGGGKQTPFITSVQKVSNPDAVAVAQLNAGIELATINANQQNFSSILGYQLGIARNATAEILGLDTNRTNVTLGGYARDAEIAISNNEREAAVQAATQQRLAQEATARYQFEATKVAAKQKTKSSIWGTIGSIAGSVLRLF